MKKHERTTLVNFIARAGAANEWKMVLVEEGPWTDSIDVELRRVQERLYGCVDAALEGKLAEKFPQSRGKKVVIQLDCYNLPRVEVSKFFDRFAEGIFLLPDYKQALSENPFASSITFELNFDSIN